MSGECPADSAPGGAITVAFDEGRNSYRVSGPQTYLVRADLKKLGGRFFGRGDRSFWAVPGEAGPALEALVAQVEAGAFGALPERPKRAAKKAQTPGDVQILGATRPRGACPLRERAELPLGLAEFPAGVAAGREEYQVVLYLVPKPIVGFRVTAGGTAYEIRSVFRSTPDSPIDRFEATADGGLSKATFVLDGARFRLHGAAGLGDAATFY